jgi:D-xylonolactonase
MQIECVAAVRAQLGEGPLWDDERGLIWWLDIRSQILHRHEIATGINHAQALECQLTALALTQRNTFIACGERGFVRLSVAADLTVSISAVIAAPEERPGNRFNDGKVDDQGRFWAGTMDDEELGAFGSLYRLEAGGGVVRIRTGITVPNGPCFLDDGTVLTTDSPRGLITAIQLDRSGHPVAERVFARFEAAQGFPDGMTVDADNHVWVAFWDGWCVRRLSPAGQIVSEVTLPVRRPTCPVFGGDRLQQLYLTTAATGLTADALARQPWAGNLLRFDPGVRGRPQARFRD